MFSHIYIPPDELDKSNVKSKVSITKYITLENNIFRYNLHYSFLIQNTKKKSVKI